MAWMGTSHTPFASFVSACFWPVWMSCATRATNVLSFMAVYDAIRRLQVQSMPATRFADVGAGLLC